MLRMQYVYLPRDLDTYLREEPNASVLFSDMFSGTANVGPNNETGATDQLDTVGVSTPAQS